MRRKVKEKVWERRGKGQSPWNESIVKEIARLEMEQERLRVSEQESVQEAQCTGTG